MSRSRLALTGTRPAMINTLRMFKSRILQCLLSPGHVIWQARKQPKTRAAALNGRRGTGVTALRLNTHSATDEGEDETRARERGGGVGKLQGVTQGDWETEQLQEKSWEIVEGSEDRAGRAVARGGDTGHSGAEMHDVACAKDAAEGDTEDDFLNGPDRGGRGGGGKVGRGKSEGEKPDAHDRGIHTDAQDKGMQKKRPRPQWDSGLRRSLAHRLVLLPRSMRYSSA